MQLVNSYDPLPKLVQSVFVIKVKVKAKVNVCAHGGIASQQTSPLARIRTRMEEQQSCNSDHHGASTILVEP